MRRIMNSAWLLGSFMAMSAALVVTLAHAAPPSRDSDAGLEQGRAGRAVLAQPERLPPVPVDPSNSVERLPAAVALGKRLFDDARFSANGAVSCASCHDPHKQFQDGLPVGRAWARARGEPCRIVGRRPQHVAVLGRPQGQPVGAGARAARRCGGARWQPHTLCPPPGDELPQGVRVALRRDAEPRRTCRRTPDRTASSREGGVGRDECRSANRCEPGVREHGQGDRGLREDARIRRVALRSLRRCGRGEGCRGA